MPCVSPDHNPADSDLGAQLKTTRKRIWNMRTRNPAIGFARAVILLSAMLLVYANTETPLDMAPSSYDDQYNGCSDFMEAEIHQLLQTEYSINKEFAEAWYKASNAWNGRTENVEAPLGFKDEYAIALRAYTMNTVYQKFNEAVREAGRSRQYYLGNFTFKALHYYLTKAVQVLDSVETTKCWKVFRGIHVVQFKTNTGNTIRFGQFASSSLDKESAMMFGDDTFFTIQTCYGANIQKFSFYSKENEVLIPPFETFKVTQFTKEREKVDIHLQSSGKLSNYNCEYAKEKLCKFGSCPFNSATNSKMKICSSGTVLAALLVVMMLLCD